MEPADRSSSRGKYWNPNKFKMSYFKKPPVGAGGDKVEPKMDEFGQLYGDYKSTYDRSGMHQQQETRRGGRGFGSGGRGYDRGGRGYDRGGRGYNRGGRGYDRGGRGYDRGGRGFGSGGRGSGSVWVSTGGGGGYWRKLQEFLKPGMKGFLCTTNAQFDNDCVQELYGILNEYYEGGQTQEDCLKQEKTEVVKEKEEQRSEEIDCQDTTANKAGVQAEDLGEPMSPDQMAEVEESDEHRVAEEKEGDSLKEGVDKVHAKKLKDLKSHKTVHKTQSVKTGVDRTVFIKTNVDAPEQTEVVRSVFEQVISNQRPKSRHIMKFLPIELTCYADNLEEIESKGKELVEKYLKVGKVSYRIICNSQFNATFMKEDFITTFASMVGKANPLSFVDVENAQFTICVEVLKSIMCIGIVKDFQKFHKYDLFETGLPRSQEKPETKRKNGANSKDNKKKINAKSEVPNSRDQVGADLQKEEIAFEVRCDEVVPNALGEENQVGTEADLQKEETAIEAALDEVVVPNELADENQVGTEADLQKKETAIEVACDEVVVPNAFAEENQAGTEADLQKEEIAIEAACDVAEENQDDLNAAVKSDEGQEAQTLVVALAEGGKEDLNPVVETADEGHAPDAVAEENQDDLTTAVKSDEGQETKTPVIALGEGEKGDLDPIVEPTDEGHALDVPDSSVETNNTVKTSLNEAEPASASEPETQAEGTACEINCAGSSDDAEKNNQVQVEQNEDNQQIENAKNNASENIPKGRMEEETDYYNNHYWKFEFAAIDL